MRRALIVVSASVALVALVFAVAWKEPTQGAIAGAAPGGVADTVIDKATGSTVSGAISGAARGGVAGAVIKHQMDRQAQELADHLPGATVQRIGEGITVTFPAGLLFGFGSDHLRSAASDNLRELAASLEKYPITRMLIVGHTDSDGSARYNKELSNRRALSVASFVTGEGVDRARISTVGRGANEPIATNDSDDGRRQNRRVEIAIYTNAGAGNSSGN
jgi:outer membrane protein OmpA-like peptidoglycan-associated protein